MKLPSLLFCGVFALTLEGVVSTTSFGQDTTPPVVANAISDVTVAANAGPTVINLKKTFALQGISGKIVRLATTEGNIDIGLYAKETPLTVANFLSYANGTDTATQKVNYNGSFIHRVATLANDGVSVIQGGGYAVASNEVVEVAQNAPVASEASISNTRGTIAVALSTGPNSGTNQWYINLTDNTALDGSSAGGPFTVFGRVVNGIDVADAIAALQIVNAGSPFNELPVLTSYNGSTVELSDLVYVNSVTNLPLTPKGDGEAAALLLKVKGNTDADVVTATISGRKLTLTYPSGKVGSSTITVLAKNPITKSKVRATFTVNVQ